jgi:hypothetical protein
MSDRRATLSGAPIGGGGVTPGLVEVDGHLTFPGGDFSVTGGDEPDILISVRVEDGVPYLHEVHLVAARGLASQITNADLKIPAQQHAEDWIKWIMANISFAFEVNPDGTTSPRLDLSDPATYTRLRLAVTRTRRREDETRKTERLEEVARIYREGGRKGAEAVKDEFGVKLRTAQLWVKQARDAGLLGPALKGKAGEAAPPPRPGRKKGKS